MLTQLCNADSKQQVSAKWQSSSFSDIKHLDIYIINLNIMNRWQSSLRVLWRCLMQTECSPLPVYCWRGTLSNTASKKLNMQSANYSSASWSYFFFVNFICEWRRNKDRNKSGMKGGEKSEKETKKWAMLLSGWVRLDWHKFIGNSKHEIWLYRAYLSFNVSLIIDR